MELEKRGNPLPDGTLYLREPLDQKSDDPVQVGKHSPKKSGKKNLQDAKPALSPFLRRLLFFFLGVFLGILFRLLCHGF